MLAYYNIDWKNKTVQQFIVNVLNTPSIGQ